MKFTGWFVVLCAVVPVPGRALETWAPSILHFPFDGPPLWISAVSVADEEKIVNLDLFDSLGLLRPVERQLRALHASGYRFQKGEKPAVSRISVSECASQVLSSCHEGENPYATLADLTTYSLAIVRGTIRTVDLGFGFGMPASLLGVEASEVIKGPAPASLFYVYYPVARFRIGPISFCNGEKGFEPLPGDEILLFDYRGPADRDEVLYAPLLEQVFFQSKDGVLFLPSKLKNTPGLEKVHTLDDAVSRLATSTASNDHR